MTTQTEGVLSLSDAERLAEQALAAIDSARARMHGRAVLPAAFNTDRERVASDLAGLRVHQQGCGILADECGRCYLHDEGGCPDARRYSDGLRRTARLYGVTS